MKLVSLDVFGTLVDVRGGSRDAFARILAAVGSNLDPLAFWEHWEHANIRRYRLPYRRYRDIARESLAETFDHFGLRGDPGLIRHYFDAFAGFRKFPDVDPVLDHLAGRVKLAVVSNIDDDLLATTPLGRTFDLVCTAERAGGYKPDGALFRHLLRASGLPVGDILHCGQSQHTDMVGAKPLGFTVCWINRRGLALHPSVPPPDHEFRDLRPILDLVA